MGGGCRGFNNLEVKRTLRRAPDIEHPEFRAQINILDNNPSREVIVIVIRCCEEPA